MSHKLSLAQTSKKSIPRIVEGIFLPPGLANLTSRCGRNHEGPSKEPYEITPKAGKDYLKDDYIES